VHLARVADDAYRDTSSNMVLVTNGCLSLTLGDDVIYNDATKTLSFPDGQTCSVSGIYEPIFRLTRVEQDLYGP
jgi:hypothetical protein